MHEFAFGALTASKHWRQIHASKTRLAK